MLTMYTSMIYKDHTNIIFQNILYLELPEEIISFTMICYVMEINMFFDNKSDPKAFCRNVTYHNVSNIRVSINFVL